MIILVNSKISHSNIQASLGKPEYSYYFLLTQLKPALEEFARVIELDSHEAVDATYRALSAVGETVLFLSATPPQLTPVDLQCPTVCLFAWEFPDAPDTPWDGNPRNDWRYALERLAGAIACSEESAQAVRNLMGDTYPVTAIPAPVWGHFGKLMPDGGWRPISQPRPFTFSGTAIDSPVLGLSADGLVQHAPRPPRQNHVSLPKAQKPGPWKQSAQILGSWFNTLRHQQPLAPQPELYNPPPSHAGMEPAQDCQLELDGVVFCSVLSPKDGRKNWDDIITAFCWAFRDNPNATLLIKMTYHDLEFYRILLLTLLSRLAPFKCRVLVLHGFLDAEEYRQLIRVSDFYVNASTCEGLCLPLMEFLSAGKPALAPRHTAMLDYIDGDIARVVDTAVELADWSHDPMGELRSQRHRLNWESLMQGFRDCYDMAQDDPDRYQQISINAGQRMRAFSDTPVIADQAQRFLTSLRATPSCGAAR